VTLFALQIKSKFCYHTYVATARGMGMPVLDENEIKNAFIITDYQKPGQWYWMSDGNFHKKYQFEGYQDQYLFTRISIR